MKTGIQGLTEYDATVLTSTKEIADYFEAGVEALKTGVHDTDDWMKSCDFCNSQEGGHYCLLHTRQMKNMNLLTCPDWRQK